MLLLQLAALAISILISDGLTVNVSVSLGIQKVTREAINKKAISSGKKGK